MCLLHLVGLCKMATGPNALRSKLLSHPFGIERARCPRPHLESLSAPRDEHLTSAGW